MGGIFKNIHVWEINFNLGNVIQRVISMTVDTGGNNRFELEVTGTTIHTYQPLFTQNGDDSYCATVNLNNLSASNSTTTTNASGGCS